MRAALMVKGQAMDVDRIEMVVTHTVAATDVLAMGAAENECG